jgi:hypothetical protein
VTAFDRWFIEADSDGQWCVWLATRDQDPAPVEFATLTADGRILTDRAWPFTPDQLGAAMTALHGKHQERTNRALRAAREAQA